MNCDPPLAPRPLLGEEPLLVGEPFCLPGGEAGILLCARFCSGGDIWILICVCAPGCFACSAPCSFRLSAGVAVKEDWAFSTLRGWPFGAARRGLVLGFGAKKDVSMRLPEVRLLRVRSASAKSSCDTHAHAHTRTRHTEASP
jgi:hypothetical protein